MIKIALLFLVACADPVDVAPDAAIETDAPVQRDVCTDGCLAQAPLNNRDFEVCYARCRAEESRIEMEGKR